MKIVVKIMFIGVLLSDILSSAFRSPNFYDSKTELSWQRRHSSKKFTWKEAIKYCRNLSYGGKQDWRLPNLYELKSLVDYRKYNPAIATNIIDIKTDDWYWSSSEYVNNSTYLWAVDFKHGRDYWFNKSNYYYAICVRG